MDKLEMLEKYMEPKRARCLCNTGGEPFFCVGQA